MTTIIAQVGHKVFVTREDKSLRLFANKNTSIFPHLVTEVIKPHLVT